MGQRVNRVVDEFVCSLASSVGCGARRLNTSSDLSLENEQTLLLKENLDAQSFAIKMVDF